MFCWQKMLYHWQRLWNSAQSHPNPCHALRDESPPSSGPACVEAGARWTICILISFFKKLITPTIADSNTARLSRLGLTHVISRNTFPTFFCLWPFSYQWVFVLSRLPYSQETRTAPLTHPEEVVELDHWLIRPSHPFSLEIKQMLLAAVSKPAASCEQCSTFTSPKAFSPAAWATPRPGTGV